MGWWKNQTIRNLEARAAKLEIEAATEEAKASKTLHRAAPHTKKAAKLRAEAQKLRTSQRPFNRQLSIRGLLKPVSATSTLGLASGVAKYSPTRRL